MTIKAALIAGVLLAGIGGAAAQGISNGGGIGDNNYSDAHNGARHHRNAPSNYDLLMGAATETTTNNNNGTLSGDYTRDDQGTPTNTGVSRWRSYRQ